VQFGGDLDAFDLVVGDAERLRGHLSELSDLAEVFDQPGAALG
jgi:hypothetical protein